MLSAFQCQPDRASFRSFNPFQGIQVLSDKWDDAGTMKVRKAVSIPFREFKCCRPGNVLCFTAACCAVSIPFREFKCCRKFCMDKGEFQNFGFQSLSGNSSVVGVKDAMFSPNAGPVSIPFREFKCCRFKKTAAFWGVGRVSIPFREFKCCRNPSVTNIFRSQYPVSIPFREFKCCRN